MPDSTAQLSPYNRSVQRAIFLVRHGEVHNPDHIVYADLAGYGLSSLGRRQAAAAAAHLAERQLAAVVSSPLERAMETAGPIAAQHGLDVISDTDLIEWRMLHAWRGLAWDELEVARPGELAAYLDHPLDLPWASETLEELASRVTRAVERIAAAVPGPVAIVSHQDPIQACRLALTHRTLAGLNRDKPRHAEVFELIQGLRWSERSRWAPDQGGPPTSPARSPGCSDTSST